MDTPSNFYVEIKFKHNGKDYGTYIDIPDEDRNDKFLLTQGIGLVRAAVRTLLKEGAIEKA